MKKNNPPIKIVNAEYLDGYEVRLTFSDGVVRDIDFGPFLLMNPHPQYDKYIDIKKFRKFNIEYGNIVWGKNWDLIFDEYELYLGKAPR
ncbi:MAG: DUF2442 domain-containing protein [Prevotellaceae bacterium]|jgi:hypothetical protein|nr:DUF2442 domain-containing protein [Prevotellaceae bacterium]